MTSAQTILSVTGQGKKKQKAILIEFNRCLLLPTWFEAENVRSVWHLGQSKCSQASTGGAERAELSCI